MSDQEFRLQLAASALAPALRDALAVLEDHPSTSFADLPRYERDLWEQRSLAVIQFFHEPSVAYAAHPTSEMNIPIADAMNTLVTTPLFDLAVKLARRQFTPIKGGKP